MNNDSFKPPKQVLVFNGAGKYVGTFCSLHELSDFSFDAVSAQSISFACTGKYFSAGSHYFRFDNENVDLEKSDFYRLNITEYDKLCGEKRSYHSPKFMALKGKRAKEKNRTSKKKKGNG